VTTGKSSQSPSGPRSPRLEMTVREGTPGGRHLRSSAGVLSFFPPAPKPRAPTPKFDSSHLDDAFSSISYAFVFFPLTLGSDLLGRVLHLSEPEIVRVVGRSTAVFSCSETVLPRSPGSKIGPLRTAIFAHLELPDCRLIPGICRNPSPRPPPEVSINGSARHTEIVRRSASDRRLSAIALF